MRNRVDAKALPSNAAPPRAAASPRVRRDGVGVLALQQSVGNRAVVAALRGDPDVGTSTSQAVGSPAVPVLQRRLYALDAQFKPGRLPDTERASVKNLLLGNGFTQEDCKRAWSDPAHKIDLEARHASVCVVEDKFTHGSNINADKRRRLRVELADVYDRLLDAAARYRDDAVAAYDKAVEDRVDLIRTQTPDNQLYRSGAKIWNASAKQAITGAVVGQRLLTLTTTEAFQEAVFKRYNAKFRPGATPAATGLNAADTLALQAEQAAATARLHAWSARRWDAPGCNANGTWGTCASAPGQPWAPTTVNARVWAALSAWWRAKDNTYITPSDTTTHSLKKHRQLAPGDDRSPTLNYHVNVG